MLPVGRCFQSRCPWKGEMPELLPAPLPCFFGKSRFPTRARHCTRPISHGFVSILHLCHSFGALLWALSSWGPVSAAACQRAAPESAQPRPLPCRPQGLRPGASLVCSPQCLGTFGWAWFSGAMAENTNFFSLFSLWKAKLDFFIFPSTSWRAKVRVLVVQNWVHCATFLLHSSSSSTGLLVAPQRSLGTLPGTLCLCVRAAGHREGLGAASELVCWYQGLLAHALVWHWPREGSRHEHVLLVYGVGCVFVKHLGDIAGEGD